MIPDQMTAIAIEGGKGPAEALKAVQIDTPRPAPGQILIRVKAAGVNRPDLIQRMGFYPPPPGSPETMGLEVAGVVAALGEGVMRWREGRILRAQEMHASPASQEGLEMLSALAANIPPGLLRWRLSYAAIAFLDMIVDRDHDLEEGHLVLPESRFLQEAIDMVVAHCFRPEPPPDLGLASLDHRLTSN